MNLRRFLLLLIVATILLVTGVWWQAESAWAQAQATQRRIQSDLDASITTRPVLYGPATDGAAMTDYVAAIEAFKDSGKAEAEDPEGRGFEEWGIAPADAGPVCWESLDAIAPALEALRDGAHRRQVRDRFDWNQGFGDVVPDVLAMQSLASGMTLTAWRFHRDGKHEAAAEALLDVLQFERDHLDEPVAITSLVGGGLLGLTTKAFFQRTDNEDRTHPAAMDIAAFSRPALQLLAAGLARLDRPLPPLGRSMRLESTLFANDVAGIYKTTRTTGGIEGIALPGGWRFAGSLRWMMADALEQNEAFVRTLPEESADWSLWRARLAGFDARTLAEHNGLYGLFVMNAPAVAAARRGSLVAIRVLRLLVADALEEPLDLADPFGGTLRRGKVEGRTAYWSVDEDGVDQGPVGESPTVVFVR